MENNLTNEYIDTAIEELISLLGIRESVLIEKIKIPYRREDIKECVKDITYHLGLPIEINLSYVSKNYTPNNNDGFNSQNLVKTDYRGRGNEGIVAQISIPSNLPMYGSPNLKNFPINIRVSENCAEYPDSFISVMAHELSHIILYSLLHKNKDNEFYTDLTAMVLGFSGIMEYGRKNVEVERGFESKTIHTTTYGYLSDEQFNHALNKINHLINKYQKLKKKTLRETENLKSKLLFYNKTILKFEKYLKNIGKYHNKNFEKSDELKIMLMNQIGYTDQLSIATKDNNEKLVNFIEFVTKAELYSNNYIVKTKKLEEDLKISFQNLNNKFSFLNEDIQILKKYTGLFNRIKIFVLLFLSSTE